MVILKESVLFALMPIDRAGRVPAFFEKNL
jgi:hypothetical protein